LEIVGELKGVLLRELSRYLSYLFADYVT
jgi:hypothetical protein